MKKKKRRKRRSIFIKFY